MNHERRELVVLTIFFQTIGDLLTKAKEENEVFPTLEQFLGLHRENESYEIYTRNFVKRIVGDTVWSGNKFNALLSTYCTASDEAFGLLTIENNYARWTSMQGTGDLADVTGNAPTPLYTNAGKKNKSEVRAGPKKFQGWSIQGYKRFDEIHKMVKADRLTASRKDFEERMKQFFVGEQAKKMEKNRQEKNTEEDEEVPPPHDFDDVNVMGCHTDGGDNSAHGSRPPGGNEEEEDSDNEEEVDSDSEDCENPGSCSSSSDGMGQERV